MKKLLRLLLVMAGILSLMAGIYWMHRILLRHELASYQRQLQSLGEKITEKDFLFAYAQVDPLTGSNLLAACKALGPLEQAVRIDCSLRINTNNHIGVLSEQPAIQTQDKLVSWTDLAHELETQKASREQIRRFLSKSNSTYFIDWHPWITESTKDYPVSDAITALQYAVLLNLHDRHFSQADEDFFLLLHLLQCTPKPPVLELIYKQLGANSESTFRIGWEMLQYDVWTDEQLRELQNAWQSMKPLEPLHGSLEFEKLMLKSEIEYARHHWPVRCFCEEYDHFDDIGYVLQTILKEFRSSPRTALDTLYLRFPDYWDWILRRSYRTEINSLAVEQIWLDALRKIQAGQPFISVLAKTDAQNNAFLKEKASPSIFDFSNIMAPIWRNAIAKATATETMQRLMVTAIALKRYHLQYGEYPVNLAELTPKYLAAVPMDPMDGHPLRYHRNSKDTFRLYSIGIDGQDNNGTPAMRPFDILFPPFNQTSNIDLTWPEPAHTKESSHFGDLIHP